MNIFKKFLQLFSKKKETEQRNSAMLTVVEMPLPEFDSVKCLLEMPYNVVYPHDLLEPLCMAIAMQTCMPACASTDDIKLYGLYDPENESFIGSFYALKTDGVYYGNIIGSPHIISCTPDTFRFVETEELIVPLHKDGDILFVLECKYQARKRTLTVVCLKKQDIPQRNSEVLHQFGKQTSFEEAYSYWQKEFAKK